MAGSRMIGGVYHPRARGGAMSDALADAARAMNRLTAHAALRGAGLLLVLAAAAALVALVSYSSDDASLNNANLRDVTNWLGAAGRGGGRSAAADVRLGGAGLPGALFVWGARAAARQSAQIRHVAAGGLAAGHHHGGGRPGPVAARRPACRPAPAA